MDIEWTVKDCAAHWGIAPSTWRSYVARGQAPAADRRVGSTPVWDPEAVRAWKRPGRGARTDLNGTGQPPVEVVEPTS